MATTIGIPKESDPLEQRVSVVPDVAVRLVKAGLQVNVESGAGESSHFADEAYAKAGCSVVDRNAAFSSDLVAKVLAPNKEEIGLMPSGTTLISFLRPLDEPQLAASLAQQGVTALSMELVPRTTRAQKMDALSAMSSVGGYKAVLLAAVSLPKFFPLLTTAAGTVRPAQVLILGAGVAGLQAIATARRLGAVVSAYDVRPAARQEVESLGARFVEIDLETAEAADTSGYAKALAEDKQERQVQLLRPFIAKSDVVITTALIPGRPAPTLIDEEGVQAMTDGSVIIDMAAANGGNCTLTEPNQVVVQHGVEIHGSVNLPAEMPLHASQMYARTVSAMILEFTKEGTFTHDFEDDIFEAVCVTHDGNVVNERVRGLLEPSA